MLHGGSQVVRCLLDNELRSLLSNILQVELEILNRRHLKVKRLMEQVVPDDRSRVAIGEARDGLLKYGLFCDIIKANLDVRVIAIVQNDSLHGEFDTLQAVWRYSSDLGVVGYEHIGYLDNLT